MTETSVFHTDFRDEFDSKSAFKGQREEERRLQRRVEERCAEAFRGTESKRQILEAKCIRIKERAHAKTMHVKLRKNNVNAL